MSLLMDKTIRDFSSLLASNEPAPGGGSTAALSGVLASSLSMMVVQLTVGKKSYEALDEKIKQSIQEDFMVIKTLNEELTELVDEDTKAFNLFMEAMKMPKITDEEKLEREERMQRASEYALAVPLRVAEKCLKILKHQEIIAKYGNKNAVSDIGVGVLLALSGLEGAGLNVKINLPSIANNTIKMDASEKLEAYLLEGKSAKSSIMEIINQRI
jgi:methenyltetrahydrofolate cyclohydrolase